MQKGNTKVEKESRGKPSATITEEDQNKEPLLRILYKRTRNLNKKLESIAQLEQRDPSTLKPEQVTKIQNKEEFLADLKKTEDFIIFYKEIAAENAETLNDNTENLIQISTLLGVGQYINISKHQPKEINNVYQNIVKPVTEYRDQSMSLTDRIAEIFNSLNNYQKNPQYYEECRDYITYLPEDLQFPKSNQQPIEPVQNKPEYPPKQKQQLPKAKVQVKIQSSPKVIKQQVTTESKPEPPIQQKPQEQPQTSKVETKESPKVVESKKVEKVKKSWNDVESDENSSWGKNSSSSKEKKKEEKKKVLPAKENERHQGNNVESNGRSNQNKPAYKRESDKPRRDERQEGRDGRQANKYQKGGYQRGQNQRYQPREAKYEQKDGYRERDNKQRGEKTWERKKRTQKDSDTSLEPTPEKVKEKKPKYIEKK